MKRKSFVFFIFCILSVSLWAESESSLEKKIVAQTKALDPAIISVRPAYVRERDRLDWMPVVTLAAKTSEKKQREIAKKLADLVVRFQNGVRTEDVEGGMLASLEGEHGYPIVGQVFYNIVQHDPLTIEVGIGLRAVEDDVVSSSCCATEEMIGRIVKSRFVSF
ncbi:MAG: hypothetical protein HY877_01215 [Deltaproteobacteria bacterium]|nr:hypothetical protein [Deltaproteobacteria bacterium]